MPQSNVYAIFQDSRGYLWLGTGGGGLSRFDGLNFITFSKKKGLAGNVVRTIIEDTRGFIWIGTDEGISVYNGLKFITIDTGRGLSSNLVLRLYEDSYNNIWAGTAEGGLNKIRLLQDNLDSVIIEMFTMEHGLSTNFIFDIYEDKNKRLWLAAFNGGIDILTFSKEKTHIDYLKRGIHIPGDQILTIEDDSEGNLWFGTYGAGAFKIITSGSDSGNVITYNETNGLNDNTVWDILCDRKGNIWFATNDGGINKLHPSSSPLNKGGKRGVFTEYTEREGLPNNQILTVYEDNEGNIWFGTMGSGVCRLMGDHFAHYTEKEGLSNSEIFDIEQDENGCYWLASGGGGIMRLCLPDSLAGRDLQSRPKEQNVNSAFTNYTTKEGLVSNSVTSLSIASDGTIWIASNEGISKLAIYGERSRIMSAVGRDFKSRQAGFTNYTAKQGLADNWVNCIFVDSKNIVWCGTREGVSSFNEGKFFSITEDKGLINNEIQTIIEDHSGNLWFGTLNGLVKYDMRSLTNYDEAEGLFNKKIHCLAEDHLGNIWIGTFGGGLYKFNVHSQDSMPIGFVSDDALLGSNNIKSLIFQDENTLIVGTDKGFDKLFLDNGQKIIKVRNYNASDGFTGVENNLNAVYKDKKGSIWFGTVNGVTRYDPAAEKINNDPPKTHITNLKLSFENVNWQSRTAHTIPWFNLPYQLNLPYSSNHLTFEFAGVSLSNPEKILYKYQLEGLEPGWSPPRKESEVIYPSLPPGEYTFKVIAKNENDIWNPEPVTYNFTINPPFWQTWWFYALCAFVGISAIVTFIKVRERNLIREKMALEEKVKERTIELATKNKEITDSINYASHIQQAILPSLAAIDKRLPENFILFAPKDIVSGDFYWYADRQGKVFIAACDCTGHGVPGAFVSMIGNNLLNQIILEKNIEKPGEILSMLNNGIKSAFTREGEQGAKDGMDMTLCVFTKGLNTLEFAGANNPMYIVRKGKNTTLPSPVFRRGVGGEVNGGELEIIKGDKASIGGDTKINHVFTNHTIELKKGDTVYLSSDGYQDQFGGPQGKKFTRKQLRDLLLLISVQTMAEQKEILTKSFNDWKGKEEQVDDILVIGVRV